jgi:shikimate dehydrogenase
MNLQTDDRVLLLGAGGACRAILYALTSFPVAEVTVAARREEAATDLRAIRPVSWVPWPNRGEVDANVLVNASPIGMAPGTGEMAIDPAALRRFRTVLDVIAAPPATRLSSTARQGRALVVDGLTMALRQAGEQFDSIRVASRRGTRCARPD